MDYTLPNKKGNPYDFGDPEYWEAHGADPHAALVFARGFPEYWRDASDWYSKPDAQKYAALIWCINNYGDFVSNKVRLFPRLKNSQLSLLFNEEHLSKYASDEHDHFNEMWKETVVYHNSQEPIEYCSNGPFFYLQNEFHGGDDKLEIWSAVARTYADYFGTAYSSPGPLPPGIKRRELLPDGSQFLARTRLAEQVILETQNDFQLPHASIRWGPLLYRLEPASKRHFLVVGMPRSGKTSLLRLLIQSIHRNPKARCIVYDFKTDLVSCLVPPQEGALSEHYHLLNPFDARGSAWDIAKDVDENSADTLASILLGTEQQGDNSYFMRIPRSILSAVVRALIAKAGNEWTFLDLMLAIQSDNIRSVLDTTAEGRRLYNANIKGGEGTGTQQNVISELNDCSQRYIRIAAAWSRASQKISLREWARNDSKGILLGNSIRNAASIKPINRAIIHFLFIELLDNTVSKPCHTFMVLDEFSRLGLLPQIVDTMEAAPSQGLSLVLGVHDFDTVKGVYGVSATAILGACGFRAYLRNENSETARWVSSLIGDQDVLIQVESSSQSESFAFGCDETEETRRTQGTSFSRSTQRITRPAVAAESIMQLPLADKSIGIEGYFAGPDHPLYRGSLNRQIYLGPQCEHTEDIDSIYRYYLWLINSDDHESNFVKNHSGRFSLPNDSFGSLEILGFKYDPTSHSQPLQISRRKVKKDNDSASTEGNAKDAGASLNSDSGGVHEQHPNPDSPNITSDEHVRPILETNQRNQDLAPDKKHDLRDYVWDDELENFRLRTEDD